MILKNKKQIESLFGYGTVVLDVRASERGLTLFIKECKKTKLGKEVKKEHINQSKDFIALTFTKSEHVDIVLEKLNEIKNYLSILEEDT